MTCCMTDFDTLSGHIIPVSLIFANGGPMADTFSQMTDHASGPPRPFVELAYLGKNAWWRYALGFVLIVGIGVALGSAAILAIQALFDVNVAAFTLQSSDVILQQSLTVQALIFIALMLSIAVFLVPLRLLAPWLHNRPWQTYLSNGRFNWHGFYVSLAGVLLIGAIGLAVGFTTEEERFALQIDWHAWAVFAVLAVILVPFQVLAEEVMMRGYVMQLIGRATGNVLLRLLLPALIFTALHIANPEALAGGAWALGVYFCMAIYLGFLVLWGDGLEYAFGTHLGNNLFVTLFVTMEDATLVTPALVIEPMPDWGPQQIFEICLFLGLHFAVVWSWMRLRHGGPRPRQVLGR